MRVSGRSQQMGGRGLKAPAARWLVDGSGPARSEWRVAAVFLVAFAALLALVLPAQGQTDVCSRTPEVRDAIVAETGAAACSAVTSTQLASITYLEITGYSSANIVPADFAGLTTLDVLAIIDSPALTTVPANAFSEVTSLTGLSLEKNSISSVHVDAFNGLSVLGRLVIFNNHIEVLEDGVFAGMDALYEISMQYNLVSALDEDTFAGAPNLSIIDLAFNRVSSVHKDTFAGLDDTLSDLSLQGNRISSLPAGIFDGLTSLWRLHLEGNRISSLPAGIFDDLTNLGLLYLSGNEIVSLDADLFENNTGLLYLLLHRNMISSLPAGIFDDLTGLFFLALSYNNLSSLDADLFDGLTGLGYLYLNNNDISSLNANLFDGLDALTVLYLNNNDISSLNANLFDGLDALQELYLYNNMISSLPAGIFGDLTALTILNLRDNGLTALDPMLFTPFASTLTFLDIRDNSFATPPTPAALGLTNSGLTFYSDQTLLPDTGLSEISINPGALKAPFVAPGPTTTYATVASDDPTTTITITITPRDPNAQIVPRPDQDFGTGGLYDNDLNRPGWQVKLPNHRNLFRWKVVNGSGEMNYDLQVFRAPPDATGKPTIRGRAEVGQTLTAHTSGISDRDGNTKAENGDVGYAYSYQWYRVDGGTETLIPGATENSYTLGQLDANKTFKVKVSFRDDEGYFEGPLKSTEYPPIAENGALQLADGPSPNEGRLEVFHNGEWGTVCDDRFDNQDNIAPQFACELMGYADGGELVPRGNSGAAAPGQPIWLDDLRCFAGSMHWTGAPPEKLHHCYHAGWGLNNCIHDEDVYLSCFGTVMNQTEATPLTATFEAIPSNHDGSSAFTFRVAFSAEVKINRQKMRDHALTVTGGTVTDARRVDGRKDLWELTVEPAGTGAVFILVPLNRPCSETGALCTADGRMLVTAPAQMVPGPPPAQAPPPAPLTASFLSVPAEHDGETAFWLELSFDAAVVQGSKPHIEALLGVSGGSVTKFRRKDEQRAQWRIRISPASHEAVTVTLSPSPACGETGAVCTDDGRTFTTAIAQTIPGPATPRHLIGTDDDDTLSGQDGNDTLEGGLGDDTLDGGAGDDTLYGDDGDPDVTDPAEGDDVLDGEGGDDVLYGDAGDDTLYGGADNDELYGDADDDELYGESGDDDLYGGGGDDVLDGGGGADILTGGAGADTFVFAAGHGTDTITDFSPEEVDLIDLRALSGITGFAALTLTAEDTDTLLDLSAHGGGTVRLEDIAVADLAAEDFLLPSP